jgi:hypothetical protein
MKLNYRDLPKPGIRKRIAKWIPITAMVLTSGCMKEGDVMLNASPVAPTVEERCNWRYKDNMEMDTSGIGPGGPKCWDEKVEHSQSKELSEVGRYCGKDRNRRECLDFARDMRNIRDPGSVPYLTALVRTAIDRQSCYEETVGIALAGSALDALAGMRRTEALSLIVEMRGSSDDCIRDVANRAMKKIDDPKIIDIIGSQAKK